jgi:hypothetical protein
MHDPLSQLAIMVDPAILMCRLGFEPDPWQARVLRSTAARMLMLCSRQSGKSTTTAILGLAEALVRPRHLVLVVSPSQRQSGELLRKVVEYYDDLGRPVPPDQVTATTLSLVRRRSPWSPAVGSCRCLPSRPRSGVTPGWDCS